MLMCLILCWAPPVFGLSHIISVDPDPCFCLVFQVILSMSVPENVSVLPFVIDVSGDEYPPSDTPGFLPETEVPSPTEASMAVLDVLNVEFGLVRGRGKDPSQTAHLLSLIHGEIEGLGGDVGWTESLKDSVSEFWSLHVSAATVHVTTVAMGIYDQGGGGALPLKVRIEALVAAEVRPISVPHLQSWMHRAKLVAEGKADPGPVEVRLGPPRDPPRRDPSQDSGASLPGITLSSDQFTLLLAKVSQPKFDAPSVATAATARSRHDVKMDGLLKSMTYVDPLAMCTKREHELDMDPLRKGNSRLVLSGSSGLSMEADDSLDSALYTSDDFRDGAENMVARLVALGMEGLAADRRGFYRQLWKLGVTYSKDELIFFAKQFSVKHAKASDWSVVLTADFMALNQYLVVPHLERRASSQGVGHRQQEQERGRGRGRGRERERERGHERERNRYEKGRGSQAGSAGGGKRKGTPTSLQPPNYCKSRCYTDYDCHYVDCTRDHTCPCCLPNKKDHSARDCPQFSKSKVDSALVERARANGSNVPRKKSSRGRGEGGRS
jgi:hypothetical protein